MECASGTERPKTNTGRGRQIEEGMHGEIDFVIAPEWDLDDAGGIWAESEQSLPGSLYPDLA
jgi:hypothetical protein